MSELSRNPSELETLARRAASCKHFRWMPGMIASFESWAWRIGNGEEVKGDFLPDLLDPATVGCLLAMARVAWAENLGKGAVPSTVQTPTGWGVGAQFSNEGFSYIVLPNHPNEASALVAALESAPSAKEKK
jgi:hypothetical protein